MDHDQFTQDLKQVAGLAGKTAIVIGGFALIFTHKLAKMPNGDFVIQKGMEEAIKKIDKWVDK